MRVGGRTMHRALHGLCKIKKKLLSKMSAHCQAHILFDLTSFAIDKQRIREKIYCTNRVSIKKKILFVFLFFFCWLVGLMNGINYSVVDLYKQ